MTVFKPPRGKTWRFDFRWRPPGWTASKGKRETGNTGQFRREDAQLVESKIKLQLRQEAWGIAAVRREDTPTFTAWAAQHVAHVKKRGKHKRLDALVQTLRLCLQFWGRRPARRRDVDGTDPQWRHVIARAQAREDAAPYHDLRLIDPILEPQWIERFEDWMRAIGLSGPRKNHYRSAMSGLYRTALLPPFRQLTKVRENPFRHLERDHVPARETTLTLPQLRAWLAAAPPHARLAMAIAAYAPELRRASILQLRWMEHLDPELKRIVVREHKTSGHTRRPQVVPIDPDLRTILEAVRQANPTAEHVVTFRSEPVERLETALRAAVTRANAMLPTDQRMVYGVRRSGVTFHTIRHTMATMLAELGIGEELRRAVMGHATSAMTQRYTHLAATSKVRPLRRLGQRLQLAEVVQGPVQAPRSRPAQKLRKSTQPPHAAPTVLRRASGSRRKG